MNIYFDMDYTLISFTGSLRPGAQQLFQRLLDAEHTLYIWSGMGVRVAEVTELGLFDMVSGVFQKPVERFERGICEFGIEVRPDAVVDDYVEIVDHFGGVVVRPYFWPDPRDRELEKVYAQLIEIGRQLKTGEG